MICVDIIEKSVLANEIHSEGIGGDERGMVFYFLIQKRLKGHPTAQSNRNPESLCALLPYDTDG